MKGLLLTAVLLALVSGVGSRAAAQTPTPDSVIDDIAESHVRANVPDGKDFDSFLKRDLAAYFKGERKGTIAVEYELLRDGPTQTGISFPKFYAWVKAREDGRLFAEGAARLAAVEKKRFGVTDFLSREDAARDPEGIYRVFPRDVGDKIRKKLAGPPVAARRRRADDPPLPRPRRQGSRR